MVIGLRVFHPILLSLLYFNPDRAVRRVPCC